MQHWAIRTAVAVLTFCTGLALSALWGLFTPSATQGTMKLVVNNGRSCPSSVKAEVPPPPPAAAPVHGFKVVSGGVLNNKSISKPAPAYPEIAKAARAEGTVVVRVLVDHAGNVEEAEAVSGHPLLQSAAVSAVRQWRFTPTLLSGQPVKVSGNVTVNFRLQ